MAFFTKSHGSAGCGGANRRGPRGGLAKGTPRKTATGSSNPSKLTYVPRTLPCRVATTGGDGGCPVHIEKKRGRACGERSELRSRWVWTHVTLSESLQLLCPCFFLCKKGVR